MNIDVGAKNEDAAEIAHSAIHHDTLWLSDGNIVLATNTYLFRVHKSVLAMRSNVFRDMFALPTPEDSISGIDGVVGIVPELYEGLPVVSLSDDGTDIEHLLKTIYESRYYDIHENHHSIDKVDALSRLNLKYDFRSIRLNVVEHFSRIYPADIDEYEAVYIYHPMRVLAGIEEGAKVLKSAIEAGIDELFPTLYYACAGVSFPNLRANVPDTPAGWAALDRIVEGQRRLNFAGLHIMSTLREMTEKCVVLHLTKDREYDKVSWEREFSNLFCTPFLRELSGKKLLMSLGFRMCRSCRGTIEQAVENERRDRWDNLPEYFGLGDWNLVRAKLKSWMENNA